MSPNHACLEGLLFSNDGSGHKSAWRVPAAPTRGSPGRVHPFQTKASMQRKTERKQKERQKERKKERKKEKALEAKLRGAGNSLT